MIPHARLLRQLVVAVEKGSADRRRPPVPEAGRILWGIFADLSDARGYGMSGPLPIAYADIESYARLHRWPLQPHHVVILRAMDDAWLRHAYAGRQDDENAVPRSSGQAVNPAAFDAVFG